MLDSHPYKPSSFFPSSEDHLIPYYNPEQSYAEDHVLGGAELPTRSFSHNDSMGPCERCGELILIKDLVWHEVRLVFIQSEIEYAMAPDFHNSSYLVLLVLQRYNILESNVNKEHGSVS